MANDGDPPPPPLDQLKASPPDWANLTADEIKNILIPLFNLGATGQTRTPSKNSPRLSIVLFQSFLLANESSVQSLHQIRYCDLFSTSTRATILFSFLLLAEKSLRQLVLPIYPLITKLFRQITFSNLHSTRAFRMVPSLTRTTSQNWNIQEESRIEMLDGVYFNVSVGWRARRPATQTIGERQRPCSRTRNTLCY